MRNNLLITLCFLFNLSIGQNQDWDITLINSEKGLSNNWVHTVFRDRWGYNWFGTENGLCRFDGKKFKIFQHEQGNQQSISFNLISDIAEAADGNMWLAINGGGINLFNPHSGQATNLSLPIHPITHTASLSGKTVCLDAQGKVWYGCYNNGLYSFDPQTKGYNRFDLAPAEDVKANSFEKNTVNDLIIDKNDPNRIWIASNDYNNGLISMHTQTGKMKHYNILSAAMALMQDQDDELWIGTWGGGLVRFDIKTQKYIAYYLEPQEFKAKNWQANVVQGVARKSATELWVACHDKGLWIFDTVKKTFSKADFLLDSISPILQMSVTENGTIWLLGKEGALRVHKKTVLPLRQGFLPKTRYASFQTDEITDLVFDPLSKKTFVTYGQSDGLFAFDENLKYISITVPQIYSLNMRTLLLDANRTLWVGGNPTPNVPYSLYHLNMETLECLPVKITALENLNIHKTYIQDIIQSKNGDIWLANNVYGLIRFNLNSNTAETPLSQINEDKSLIIKSVKESSTGDIWAISESHGLIQYSPIRKNIKIYQHDLNRPKSLFEKGGNTIEEAADGTIWIGLGHNGVQIIDPKKPLDQEAKPITLADGLPSLSIVKILRDKQDNMWISTRNGMCVYIWKTKQIRRFDFGEHVSDFSNQSKGFYRNTEGVFFLGGVKNFTVFNPESILAITPPNSNIRITDIKILGKLVPFNQSLDSIERLDVGASENFVTISFAAIDALDPSLITYRYRLNSFSDWVVCGNQSELTFANLPDGDHVFEVQSTNKEGVWQNEISRLKLHINPPWYSTWWFRALLMMSVLIFSYVFYKSRIEKLKKEHNIALQINDLERTALAAQMNPHFIFNCLNSIQLLIQNNDKENAMQYLGHFAKLVRFTLESTRRGKISIDEEIQSLEHYLLLEKLRFKEKFIYAIDVDTQIDTFDTEIPAMLIQPFVENALKHGLSIEQSVEIMIILKKVDTDFIRVNILNNGKKFNKNNTNKTQSPLKKSSLGIDLTRKRLFLLNGREAENDLQIEDMINENGESKGTQVGLMIKVNPS